MPKPVMFKTAEELVAFRCFVQRVDVSEQTTWEVIDRFAGSDESRLAGVFSDKDVARELLATVRSQRLAHVKANPSDYRRAV